VLSDIQQQAIVRCLNDLDNNTQRTYPWPRPALLAVLREIPVAGHPDPTARFLGVNLLPVPDEIWEHPDGLIAGLGQARTDLNTPAIRAGLATAPAAGKRILAWVFMHADLIVDDELGPLQVRFIDAVDIDDRSYILTRLPHQPAGGVTV
jgi:hypothetical protein